jgi:ferredoxin
MTEPKKILLVDFERCYGCERCVELCPEAFTMLNNDKAFAYNSKHCEKLDLQEVVDSCPAKAIAWVDSI